MHLSVSSKVPACGPAQLLAASKDVLAMHHQVKGLGLAIRLGVLGLWLWDIAGSRCPVLLGKVLRQLHTAACRII